MNKQKIAGWILSVLLAAFLGFSSTGKFMDWEGKEEMMAKMGWKMEVLPTIGIIEIVVTILFLIPRTAFIGAILLSAYLGGAVVTHLRVDEPFYFPIGMGVLIWIALGLRDSRIFTTAFTAPPRPTVD